MDTQLLKENNDRCEVSRFFAMIINRLRLVLFKFYCYFKYPKKIRRAVIYKFKEETFKNNSCKIKFLLENGDIIEKDYVIGLNLIFTGKNNINNELIFHCDTESDIKKICFQNFNVYVFGTNSKMDIFYPTRIENSSFVLYSNSSISIKKTPHYIVDTVIKCSDNKIEIGKNFSTHKCCIFVCDEKNLNLKIGDDCMFSVDIYLWATDGHKIYDVDTKKVLNKAAFGINIGNHVWLGNGVKVLKNSRISDNTIVGAGSIVTGTFDTPNVILAGAPAKIIKKSVNWSPEAPDQINEI